MNCYNCGSKRLVCDNERDSYICKECGYAHQKQYFFISHSHQDIEKVRVIRNVIEETFFYEPILFFLKCLSNENEINDLIKREIYERIWFVYCKSENAEKSKYVQFERAYIKSLIESGKDIKIIEIDLDAYEIWDDECANYLRSQIAHKIMKTKIFLSYARCDFGFAKRISNQLTASGFTVFMDLGLACGVDWFVEIKNEVKKNSNKDGAILLLCSVDSINSNAVFEEAQEALLNGGLVIPLIYDETGERFEFIANAIKERLPSINNEFFYITKENCDLQLKSLSEYILNL